MSTQHNRASFLVFSVIVIVALASGTVGAVGSVHAHDDWATYTSDEYGFSIAYPAQWSVGVSLRNYGEKPGVIERRFLFLEQAAGVNIDVFPNPENLELDAWYEAHQLRLIPSDGFLQGNLVVGGEPALYALDPGGEQFPYSRHTVILEHDNHVYRIEYQAIDGGDLVDTYRMILQSLKFVNGNDQDIHLFDLGQTPPDSFSPDVQKCCDYTDPNPNPYPCSGGNCVWWTRYKRPDTGGQSYPYWGNADQWTTRAAQEGFPVNGTPSTGAIGGTPRSGYVRPGWTNHVAYVESFNGSTISFSDMDWNGDCSIDRWNQTDWSGIEFIHCKCCCCPPGGVGLGENPGFCRSDVGLGEMDGIKKIPAPSSIPFLTPEPVGIKSPPVMEVTATPELIEIEEPAILIPTPTHREPVEPQRIPPTSASYRIPKSVFGSGGGLKESTHYVMNSTQGQSTDLSRRTSTSYILAPGYWSSTAAGSYKVYLPLVVKNP